MKRAYKRNGKLAVKFTGGDFEESLKVIRSLYGFTFSKPTKEWIGPFTSDSVKTLEANGFAIAPNLLNSANDSETISVDLNGLQYLREYQKEGVVFAEKNNGNIINADEMGTGKTLQTLAYMKIHPELRPAVIVCPASVKSGWENEYHKHAIGEDSIHLVESQTPYDLSGYDVLIINYDILAYHVQTLIALEPQIVVSDECHYLNNSTSQRTKAFVKLAKLCPHVFCLSGTPITDYPAKFYTVLNLIKPEVFYNKKKFLWHFCDPKNNGFGWSYKGHTHSDELHRLIQPFMIRRKKSDILSELPDKTRQIISVPINRAKYDKQLAEFDNEDHKTPFMRKKSLLDDILYDEKKPIVMSFIEDMLDSEKVIVYTLYRRTIDDVLEYFGNRAVKIDGSIPVAKRREIIQGFVNNEKTRVLCANIQAVGTGVDGLQDAASHGVFINFPWESASCYQAEDRLHRIGQNNPVNVYYMVAENTIEHELIKLIDQKDKIIKEVIDGESDPVSEFLETFKGSKV